MTGQELKTALAALAHHQHVSMIVNYVLLVCLSILAVGKIVKHFWR